jgi:hypothetical protein
MDILIRRIEQLDEAQFALLKTRLEAIDEKLDTVLMVLDPQLVEKVRAMTAGLQADRERLEAAVKQGTGNEPSPGSPGGGKP